MTVLYIETEKCGICYSEDAEHRGRGAAGGGEGDWSRINDNMITYKRQGDRQTDMDACTLII